MNGALGRSLDWYDASKAIGCTLRRPEAGENDPRRWPLAVPATLDDAIVGDLHGVGVAAFCAMRDARASDDSPPLPYFVHLVQVSFPRSLGVGLFARTAQPGVSPSGDVSFATFRAKDEATSNAVLGHRGADGGRALDAIAHLLQARLGHTEVTIDDNGLSCTLTLAPGYTPLQASPPRLLWLLDEVASVAARIDEAMRDRPPSKWRAQARAAWSQVAEARGLALAPASFMLRGSIRGRAVAVQASPSADETRFTIDVPTGMIVSMLATDGRAGVTDEAIAVCTEDAAFDAHFVVEGDRDFAARLGPELRAKLDAVWDSLKPTGEGARGLSFDGERLEVVVARFFEDGPALGLAIDWLVEVAALLAGEVRPAAAGPYR